MKSFLRKCSFLFFSEGQLLFVNIVFVNRVPGQPRHFAPRIDGCPVIQLCSLHYRRYCFAPYPQFSRRARAACKLALYLAFAGQENGEFLARTSLYLVLVSNS